ncbi:MAG: Rab family GTPase [Candidatus Kariarchaeaceae archaeon]
MSENEYRVKVTLSGDYACGKTAVAIRFSQSRFEHQYRPTLGVDFHLKRVEVPQGVAKILVFDTEGQERFSGLRKRYYQGAAGAIVLFDVTRRSSFSSLDRWISELRSNTDEVLIIVCANKVDLLSEREVASEEVQAFCDEHGLLLCETSALTGEGIDEMFNHFVHLAFQ